MKISDILIATSPDGRPVLIKYDERTAFLPAWTSSDVAMRDLASMDVSGVITLSALDLEMYEDTREWCKKSGINLFINLKTPQAHK